MRTFAAFDRATSAKNRPLAFTVRFWVFFGDRESDFLVARGEAVKRIKRAFDAEATSLQAGSLAAGTADPAAFTSPAAAPADSARDPH